MNKPELYVANSSQQRRDGVEVIAEFVNAMSWKDEDTILDIGCGSGDTTRHQLLPAVPRFSRLVATDISEAMLEYARTHYQHPKLEYRQMDMMNPKKDFLDEGYDKIFSFYCLQWAPDYRRLMSNIFNLLKPGGEALLLFVASHPLVSVYEKMAKKTQWETYTKDVEHIVFPYQDSVHPAQEFRKILEETGFEIIECDCRDKSFEYGSAHNFSLYVKAISPYLDRVPTHLQDEYMTDFLLEAQRTGGISWKDTVTAYYKVMVAYVKKPSTVLPPGRGYPELRTGLLKGKQETSY